MKLICERDALSSALGHVASRARNKLKIPILEHVLINAYPDNRLVLTGTNLETRCVATVPAEVSSDGATTVSADRLARLVDGLPQGSQVKFDLKGTDLHIECGKSRYKLPTMPAEDYPEMAEIADGNELAIRAADIKRLFGETAPGLPANDARIYLFGGFLEPDSAGHIRVTATDGLRLVRIAVKNADAALDQGYIIPKPTMPELVKLAALGDLTLRFGSGLVEASVANIVFTSKLIDAVYPEMGRFIPDLAPGIMVDRAELVSALKRLTGVEDDNSTINIHWKPGEPLEMTLFGEGSGAEAVPCECEAAEGAIAFRPQILGGMLDVMKGEILRLIPTGPTSPMRIHDEKDPGLSVIAMPCQGRN